MAESVYLETTIISYLAARPSRDLVIAACQEMTRDWWDQCRPKFDLYVSERIVAEASAGDENAASRRLQILKPIPILRVSEEARTLAKSLFISLQLPQKAIEDSLHIAISIVSGMDYLLTWNCKHIANARMIPQIERIAEANGYEHPVICTPQELLEDYR